MNKELNAGISGYKGFDQNMKCRDMQYAENSTFEEDVTPEVCERGLHFCPMPLDVFGFYAPDGKNQFAEVEGSGRIASDDKKVSATKLKVGGKITIGSMFKAHFEIIKSKISESVAASKETMNTSGNESHANTAGYRSHANTAGNYSHANTAGNESIACSLGIKSRSKASKGWIIIVDWRYYDGWHIHEIYRAKVGEHEILGQKVEPDVWYWMEDGKLKSEK